MEGRCHNKKLQMEKITKWKLQALELKTVTTLSESGGKQKQSICGDLNLAKEFVLPTKSLAKIALDSHSESVTIFVSDDSIWNQFY
jgi:hypothetical protein